MSFQSADGERVMTRARMLSKSRAVMSSRNVSLSHLGEAVIKNSTTVNAAHRQHVQRLEQETLWRIREFDKSAKQFKASRDRLPGPMLIVDRPPSSASTADMFSFSVASDADGYYRSQPILSRCNTPGVGRNALRSCPGYMRPTLRTASTLPLIPSIDAFRIIQTKKTEAFCSTAVTSHPKPSRPTTGSSRDIRFRSTVAPSWPLSEDEQNQLRIHWDHHWQQLKNQRTRSPKSSRRRAAVSRQSQSTEAGFWGLTPDSDQSRAADQLNRSSESTDLKIDRKRVVWLGESNKSADNQQDDLILLVNTSQATESCKPDEEVASSEAPNKTDLAAFAPAMAMTAAESDKEVELLDSVCSPKTFLTDT